MPSRMAKCNQQQPHLDATTSPRKLTHFVTLNAMGCLPQEGDDGGNDGGGIGTTSKRMTRPQSGSINATMMVETVVEACGRSYRHCWRQQQLDKDQQAASQFDNQTEEKRKSKREKGMHETAN
ncbi:uncharacterized protein LOC117569279 [Drosophila albomicans]|uniref:Uncharacterized protein LOC117569279 n=1 Tax=Drosophila albomicans TaxID=7291 RepID=A0A6P8WR99_DROAB|nr:uncharacterized protein LOC117569279 [Drosophila albomicans]